MTTSGDNIKEPRISQDGTSHAGHSHEERSGGSKGSGALGHGHTRASIRESSRKRMSLLLVLLVTFMIIEVITGLSTGSLALLADAGHMLADAAAILLALLAIWFASKPATPDKTYGYYRSEILAGFFNALALVGISGFIMYEAYQRFLHPPFVQALPTLTVAVLGLLVNIISLGLLKQSAEQSINAHAAYLEVLSDSLASVGVIVSSLLIMFLHWYVADPIISSIIAIAILPRTWLLLKECMNILMEGTPGHIDFSALRAAMLKVEGVVDVHDIHVWTITSGLDAMSGHVTIEDSCPQDRVLSDLTKLVNDDFGIHHSTIQVELLPCKNDPCKA